MIEVERFSIESEGDAPVLEIIVVSYGQAELVRACLESARRYATTRGPQILHLVDNNSPEDVVSMVRELFPEVRVVALTENVGFAAANNLALRRVTAPRVLLLNPDSELRPGVLDHMLDLVDSDPAIGVAGCRLVRRDGSFDHAAKRRFPTPAGALGHFLGLGRRIGATSAYTQYHAVDVGEHELGDVDSVNGAFMLVRREAMEEVGLLDAGYWMYGEDLDWCRRFKLAGWRVVYDGRVTAVHVKGASAGARRGPRQNIAFHLTMGRFYRRYDGGNRAAVDAAVYAGILVKLAVSLLVNWAHSRWRQRARLHDG